MNRTAKDYAIELIDMYRSLRIETTLLEKPLERMPLTCAKQCAIICVEQLENKIHWEDKKQSAEDYTYYKEVKKEIEKS